MIVHNLFSNYTSIEPKINIQPIEKKSQFLRKINYPKNRIGAVNSDLDFKLLM